ncbi:hypothetical protein GCM10022232_91910 [Streptomyces plumbiresistens]|uniref:Transposase n=1 Tax=Streptomyces plumbiresistens TaxID=511811 RepID=A0ABP7TVD9_9ACTN
MLIAPGQWGDAPQLIPVVERVRAARRDGGRPRTRPGHLGKDKAYSARRNRRYLRRRQIKYTIPEPKNQRANRQHRGELVVLFRPVKQLPHDVRMPRVPSGLLDEMDEHAVEVGVATIWLLRAHWPRTTHTRGRECAPSLEGTGCAPRPSVRPGCSRRRRRVRRR